MIALLFLIATAAIYNLATVGLLYACLRSMDLKLMLRDKVVVGPVPRVDATAPESSDAPGRANGPDGGDSYSRITGCAGSVVLATFIWALGDAVIDNAYVAPQSVSAMLSGVAPFILSGAALFAPYAFNQLGGAFASRG